MKVRWADEAWADYRRWRVENRPVFNRINRPVKAIEADPVRIIAAHSHFKFSVFQRAGASRPFFAETPAIRSERGRPTRLCYTVVQGKHHGEHTMGTLTIRLDTKIERELARLAKQTGRSKSGWAREALRRQLAVRRFRELRRRAVPYAEAAGYLTDEDVFRDVS